MGECCLCCYFEGLISIIRLRVSRAHPTYVFETVEVLVPLAADITLERLLLLHAQCPRVWSASLGVDDGKGAVAIFMQLLGGMSMRLVVSNFNR